MRECEHMARERYLNDPVYHNIVNMLEVFLKEARVSPDELHDAVNLAANHIRVDDTFIAPRKGWYL